MANHTRRSTRASETRHKPWTPPSLLDAPPPPPGYQFRWVRESAAGAPDPMNVSVRFREGYEPVRAEEYPDFVAPTIEDGRHKGVIGSGGLILCKIPEETAEARKEYYENAAREQMRSVDNDLMKVSNNKMPLDKPQRRSSVTFGGPRFSDD